MNPKRTRIVFIAGYGRSGSTLLGQMLGRVPGAVFVGELRDIWARGVIDNEPCGCGQEFRRCEFWNAVMQRAFGGLAGLDAVQMLADQGTIDKNRNIPMLVLLDRVPGDFAAAKRPREYVRAMAQLNRAIIETAGARLIIDSSKDPSTLCTLARAPELELNVIHLLRDSRAVAHSWARRKKQFDTGGQVKFMPQYSALQSALEWDWFNGWCSALKFLGHRRMRYVSLRYEDYVREPRSLLQRTSAALGLEIPDSDFDFIGADGSAELGQNHAISGNLSRFAIGKIRLKPDDEWRSAMSAARARWIKVLTLPLMLGYGY
ncbi:MAG TPA: sulfotransferase [Candidatus Binataceae bacterium]|nr:sulfotransferase [Candidatus Binataceae bacterium]